MKRRVKRSFLDRFWAKVNKTVHCWEWTGTCARGYGMINVGGKMMAAHRISWILHEGKIPDGMMILHRCDNRRCVRPEHLFLGNHDSNMLDMKLKKRGSGGCSRERNIIHRYPEKVQGEKNGAAKLDKEKVRRIRQMHRTGWTQVKLAKFFSVDPRTINRVVSGETWSHVNEDS